MSAGLFLEDLSVGRRAEVARTVTDADVVKFAEASGDFNPVHLDEAYAQTTPFKGRIAGRTLAPGSYRLALTATDPAGNRSKQVATNFKIVRAR